MAASKFTPEARGALLERFAAGASLEDACRSVDVRVQTVKGWLKRGRKESGTDYARFAAAVDAARADARARPGVMDREELERVVSEAARKGSVAAMKLRFEQLGREPAPVPAVADPLAFMDRQHGDPVRAARALRSVPEPGARERVWAGLDEKEAPNGS